VTVAAAALMQNIPRFGYGGYAKIGLNYLLMDQEGKHQSLGRELSEDILVDLVSRSREGEVRAMEILYGHFKSSLISLAFRYTYNYAVAEDLLQDIFVKVFTHLYTLDDDKAFVRWLYRVAVNTCLSYLRTHKKLRQRTISLDEVEGVVRDTSSMDAEREANKPLEEAIYSLPAKLKSVFLLHDVQGFKHLEIAQILGCSTGTSKSQLFKARMKIRKYLEEKQSL
jgi:RNA polymerase sigma-70 factor (ECF subfamily)